MDKYLVTVWTRRGGNIAKFKLLGGNEIKAFTKLLGIRLSENATAVSKCFTDQIGFEIKKLTPAKRCSR